MTGDFLLGLAMLTGLVMVVLIIVAWAMRH